MATRRFDRRPAEPGDPGARVAFIVARHGETLTRVARSFSLCADDAHDAVQRSLEIYMRRAESLDPETELAWLKVVVKHEALAVRRGRAGVAAEEVDLDAVPAVAQRSVEERLESAERVERSAEVMRRLKRDEAKALMLKAEGLSYVEIGERLGWTYTKVNRCITEGRRRFMKLYADLEAGAECERLEPVVVALAAGEASSEALLELRPHLRNCPACRATVRALHASRLRRITAWLPLGAIVEPARSIIERFRPPRSEQALDLHPMEQSEELDEAFRRIQASEAAVQPVAPSVAEAAGRWSGARLNLRGWLEAALQRLQTSDVAMTMHAATSGGGGRVSAVAALIGICISGVGAGTYCVATALLPDPKPGVRAEAEPHAKKKRGKVARSNPSVAPPHPLPSSTSLVRARSTPTKAPTPRRNTSPRQTQAPKPSREPDEFSFERSTTAQASTSSATRSTSRTPSASTADNSFESGSAASGAGGGEFSDGAGGEFAP